MRKITEGQKLHSMLPKVIQTVDGETKLEP